MKQVQLDKHCQKLVGAFGSVRAAATKLKIDYGYLHRLASGEKTNPSDETLQKLGLIAVHEVKFYIP